MLLGCICLVPSKQIFYIWRVNLFTKKKKEKQKTPNPLITCILKKEKIINVKNNNSVKQILYIITPQKNPVLCQIYYFGHICIS